MNKVLLIGHLGKDPEVKQIGEKTVCNISLATSEKRKDKEITDWHNCVFWGKAAEMMQKYAQKGTHIYIEGKQKTRSYEDKNGVKHYVTENVVINFELLGNYKRPHVGGTDFRDDEPVPTTFNSEKDDLPF
jgi:single-strand DNA-binding protein